MTQRFRRAAFFVLLVTLIGTLGYRLIEGAGWFDSFYMVVMTITTVGFAEVFPLSDPGRVWTVLLVVSGLGAVLYTASLGLELIVQSTSLSGRRRRVQREIDRLSNHHILCGFGRIGESIWNDLPINLGLLYSIIFQILRQHWETLELLVVKNLAVSRYLMFGLLK